MNSEMRAPLKMLRTDFQSTEVGVYDEVSGAEFKKRVTDQPVHKVLNSKSGFVHGSMQYARGHNQDVLPFNPSGWCQAGGMYFTTLKHIGSFLNYGSHVATITLYDDSRVYREGNKFKADKFFIEDIVPSNDFVDANEEVLLQSMLRETPALKTVPPEHLFEVAIMSNWSNLRYIHSRHHTPELIKRALDLSGLALHFIRPEMQTPEMCKLAVSKNGSALFFVVNQTEELAMLAMQRSDAALSQVEERFRSPELCKVALASNPYAIEHIPDQTEEMCIDAVTRKPVALIYVRNPTHRVMLEAVSVEGTALRYISEENQSEEICLAAVKQNCRALEFVKKQTEEMCLIAVRKNGMCLGHVIDQTREVCIAAIKTDRTAIMHVRNIDLLFEN